MLRNETRVSELERKVQRLEAELQRSYATKNYSLKTGLLEIEKAYRDFITSSTAVQSLWDEVTLLLVRPGLVWMLTVWPTKPCAKARVAEDKGIMRLGMWLLCVGAQVEDKESLPQHILARRAQRQQEEADAAAAATAEAEALHGNGVQHAAHRPPLQRFVTSLPLPEWRSAVCLPQSISVGDGRCVIVRSHAAPAVRTSSRTRRGRE